MVTTATLNPTTPVYQVVNVQSDPKTRIVLSAQIRSDGGDGGRVGREEIVRIIEERPHGTVISEAGHVLCSRPWEGHSIARSGRYVADAAARYIKVAPQGPVLRSEELFDDIA